MRGQVQQVSRVSPASASDGVSTCLLEQEQDLPLGLSPVDSPRDPRIRRLWSKSSKAELSVAKFKVCYCLSSTQERGPSSRVKLTLIVMMVVFKRLYNLILFHFILD